MDPSRSPIKKSRTHVAANQNGGNVTVLATASEKDNDGATNEPGDVASPETTTVTFPDNTTGDEPMEDVVRFARITLQANEDPDAEDEVVAVTITLTGFGATTADDQGAQTFTIDDDEVQVIELTEDKPGDATEGTPTDLMLKPKFTPVDDELTVVLTHDGRSTYTLSETSYAFSATQPGPVPLMLTGPDNDGNRVTDTVTVSMTVDDRDVTAADTPIAIADLHVLPSVMVEVTDADGETATQLMEQDGGAEYTLTVTTVDKEDPTKEMGSDVEALKVMLGLDPSSVADASDYTLVPREVTIPAGTTPPSGILTLTVLANVDTGGDDRMERLVFQAVVSGESDYGPADDPISGVVDLDIVDNTTLTVSPLTDAAIEAAYMKARTAAAGDDEKWTIRDRALMIPLSELFMLPTQGQAEAMSADENIVDADADADASATGGGMVTVAPIAAGMADVTVTVSTGVSAFTGTQTSATSAQVVFKATVDGIPVTAKPQAEIDAAYMAARNAAAGADGYWTTEDGPATIALSALFNDLRADATPTVMSSMTDYVLASTTGSDLVLNPEGVGTSTITVTVAGVPASFMATVDTIQLDRRGRITAITIDSAEEKTINNVKRMHVQEGDLTTLSITIEWTNQQITSLWAGHTTANPPPPARVTVQERGWRDDDSWQWLSWIETREDPGSGGFGGQDVVLATNTIEVPIPRIKRGTEPNSIFDTNTGKGSTSLSLPHDIDAEEEGFRIHVSSSAIAHYLVNLETSKMQTDQIHVIEDDEVQGVKISRNAASRGTVYEGGPAVQFDITADPRREDLGLSVRYDLTNLEGVSVSSRSYSLQRSDGEIPVGSGPDHKHIARINLDPNDGNREDIDLQLHAEVVSYGLDTGAFDDIQSQKVEFTVVDVHKLPHLSVTPTAATVMEGGEIELTLTVDRNPPVTIAIADEVRQHTHEALSIAVEAGGALNDFTVAVPEHNKRSPWTQSVKHKVKVPENDDVDVVDGETVAMLNFVVNGTESTNGPRPDSDPKSTAQVELTIQDATGTLVSVKDGAYDAIKAALGEPPTLTTGMSGGLMGGELFEYDASAVSVTYGTSVEGGAVTASASDDGMVTIMAVMAGEAKVSITATATANTSSLMIDQTKPNVAMLTFPVMVEDAPLEPLVFTVSAEDGAMDLVEGGAGIKVTVMTNRAVTENTEVMLMRDGGSSATDDDYELFPPMVTILAGDMSGSVMVTALADDMMENEGNMPEMLTLFLVADGIQMTDKSVSFHLWDAAVPALPIIAQLLLAAFLAIGGYRRYRRR